MVTNAILNSLAVAGIVIIIFPFIGYTMGKSITLGILMAKYQFDKVHFNQQKKQGKIG